MWLINLVPILLLLVPSYLFGSIQVLGYLGFGTGVGLIVVLLSLIFLRKQITIGFFLNLILLCFVFLSYILPQFDSNPPSFFIFFLAMVILPFLIIVGSTSVVMSYPLIKKVRSYCVHWSFLLGLFLYVPGIICVLAFFVAGIAQKNYNIKFSIAFVGWQIFSWITLLVILYMAEYFKKVNFDEVRNYIIKERALKIKIKRQNISISFIIFLVISTIFETFRGLWLLWFGTAIWLILIFASLWKIWKHVFDVLQPEEIEGTP